MVFKKSSYFFSLLKTKIWTQILTAKRQNGHIPVMLNEVVDGLNIREGQTILDMTFGAGGHTKAILDSCKSTKVIALDRDPFAHNIANILKEEYGDRIVPVLGKFSELNEILPRCGINKGELHGAVLDAGCSSMQFDMPERGFSIRQSGPLDMRMDGAGSDSITAADVVNSLNAEELQDILSKYGEEEYSKTIAEGIMKYRILHGSINTTSDLVNAIESSFRKDVTITRRDSLNRKAHLATKTFMALRIFVNDEFNELAEGINIIEDYIKSGGRLTVLTFHSNEDRIVKRIISGIDLQKPKNMTLKLQVRRGAKLSTKKESNWIKIKSLKLPQYREVKDNPRSRSAKLRIASRL